MKKSSFVYLRTIVLALGFILVSLPTLGVAQSEQKPPTTRPFIPRNIISPKEVNTLDSFRVTLGRFDKLVIDLNKRRPFPAETSRLEATAKDLKRRIPLVKSELQTFIQRVKVRGKWTNEFDSAFEREVTQMNVAADMKAKFVEWVKQNGGARAVITEALSQLGEAAKEIDSTVGSVKRAQVPTEYAAAKKRWSWKCWAVGGLGIVTTVAGCGSCGVGASIYIIDKCL